MIGITITTVIGYSKKKGSVLSLFRTNNMINVRTMNEGEYPPVGGYSSDGQIVIHLPQPRIPSIQENNIKKNEDVLPTYEQATRMKLFQSDNS